MVGDCVRQQLQFDFESLDRPAVRELWKPDEIYSIDDAEALRKFYEDKRVERKPAGIHADSLATYVCMYANTPPDGGIIVLGIAEDGQVEGCIRKAEHIVDVERRIRCDLVPDAKFEIKSIRATTHDGREDFLKVLRVRYTPDMVVETNKGEAYIRWADTRHLLSPPEVQELQIERGQKAFELMPCSLAWPDKFDVVAIRAWIAGVKRLKHIDNDLSTEQALCAHRLGAMVHGVFVPNNACALLFATDPQDVVPGCMVRFQRIEGREAMTGGLRNVVKDIQITGTVPRMIEEAHKVIDAQLRTFSRLGKDSKFYTCPEYPDEAWHEMIVNACAHRSYSLRGMNIFVRMYDDRLEVDSPGGFLPFVNPDNIYEAHYRRNWWLMDAMFFMEYVKCEGEGTKRMRRAMEEMNLPAPEFSQKQLTAAVVRVTLKNNLEMRDKWVDADVTTLLPQHITAQLSDQQKRLVNFAAEHGKINVTEALRLLPAARRWHNAKKELETLVTLGALVRAARFSRDSKSHYVLAEFKKQPSDYPRESSPSGYPPDFNPSGYMPGE